MVRAVAKRPVEQFQTDVPMPDWQLEPGEESYLGNEELPLEPLVDENGNPIGTQLDDPLAPTPVFGDQQQGPPVEPTEVDRIFGTPPPLPERPAPAPFPRQERLSPSAPADSAQRRPEPAQF
jgi:penicillin-binding protein 1A